MAKPIIAILLAIITAVTVLVVIIALITLGKTRALGFFGLACALTIFGFLNLFQALDAKKHSQAWVTIHSGVMSGTAEPWQLQLAGFVYFLIAGYSIWQAFREFRRRP